MCAYIRPLYFSLSELARNQMVREGEGTTCVVALCNKYLKNKNKVKYLVPIFFLKKEGQTLLLHLSSAYSFYSKFGVLTLHFFVCVIRVVPPCHIRGRIVN
jgi:hypothetical protein